jgi:hypothetical protein
MSFRLASWSGVSVVLMLAVVFAMGSRSSSLAIRRVAAALGFVALVPLFMLGAIWPSVFTIAALLALPAGVVLLAAIASPSLLRGSKTRAYSLVAAFFSPLLLIAMLWSTEIQPEVSNYKVISSSFLQISEAGQPPPGGCAEVGTVTIPQRNPGFFDRHFGLAEAEFYQALDEQLEPLKANLLVPNVGFDAFTAGSSGQAFQGTAYSCP